MSEPILFIRSSSAPKQKKNLQDRETWGRGLGGMDREKKVYVLENKFFHILPLRVGEMF